MTGHSISAVHVCLCLPFISIYLQALIFVCPSFPCLLFILFSFLVISHSRPFLLLLLFFFCIPCLFSTPPVWERNTWRPTDQTRTDAPFLTTNWIPLAGLTPLLDHSPQSTKKALQPQHCLNPVLTANSKIQHGPQHQSWVLFFPVLFPGPLNLTNTDRFISRTHQPDTTAHDCTFKAQLLLLSYIKPT